MTFEFPTEEKHFRARFNPLIGVAYISVGLVVFFLSLQGILSSGDFSVRIFLGILLAVVGTLYLRRPYFAIAPNRLTVYNLFGQVIKRYPFINFNNIEVDEGKVYIRAVETSQNPASSVVEHEIVKIRQWMTKSSDWKKFQALTSQ